MIAKLLADFVILIHFLWIIFLLFGLVWAWRSLGVAALHLAGLILTLILNLGGWYCPLTDVENYLRGLHDPNLTYAGSFIVRWIEKAVYVDVAEMYLRIGAVVWVGLNLTGYGILFKRKMSRRRFENRSQRTDDRPEALG